MFDGLKIKCPDEIKHRPIDRVGGTICVDCGCEITHTDQYQFEVCPENWKTYSQAHDAPATTGMGGVRDEAVPGTEGHLKQVWVDDTLIPPDKRLDREDFFMEMARLCARRSTCLRGHVGCVIVQDRRVISLGYNGAPPGMDHCLDVGCDMGNQGTINISVGGTIPPVNGCKRSIHAELNAIAHAAKVGVPVNGATMYSTYSPCLACAQAIVSAGIHRFVYENEYREGRLDILSGGKVIHNQHTWQAYGTD